MWCCSLVEESDFKATKELFGGKKGEKSLDDFIPKTEAEFEEFAEIAAAKMAPYSVSTQADFWQVAKGVQHRASRGLWQCTCF